MSSTVKIYKAEVVTVIDGSRNVTVTAPHLVNCTIEVQPLLDGTLKVAVPDVGDAVWIIDPLGSGTYRRYIPVNATFTSLTDNPDDTELESKNGDVWVEGGIIYLGADSDDWVAMASLVGNELSRIKSDLDALKILLTTHTHEFPPGSGILTDVDKVVLPNFTPTPPGSVASSKTKSET